MFTTEGIHSVITREYSYEYNGKIKHIKRTYEVKLKRFSEESIRDYIDTNRESLQALPQRIAYEQFKNNTNSNMSFSWFYNHIIKGI